MDQISLSSLRGLWTSTCCAEVDLLRMSCCPSVRLSVCLSACHVLCRSTRPEKPITLNPSRRVSATAARARCSCWWW